MTVDSVINELVGILEKDERETNEFRNNDGWTMDGRRNDLAFEAAEQNADKGRQLRMMNNSQVLGKMWEAYENSKDFEKKYRDWGGHDNGYAEQVHGRSKDAFYNAFLAVKKLQNTCADANFDLVLLFSTDGGSSGTKIVKVTTGHSEKTTISSDLTSSISASITGPLSVFTGTFNASVSASLKSSFETSSFENREDSMTINLNKPCYVYQVKGTVKNGLGSMFVLGGTIQCFDHDIKKGK